MKLVKPPTAFVEAIERKGLRYAGPIRYNDVSIITNQDLTEKQTVDIGMYRLHGLIEKGINADGSKLCAIDYFEILPKP